MLVPSLFTDNFVNDWFNDAFNTTPTLFKASGSSLMSADVKDLTIEAKREDKKDDSEDEAHFIRRERYVGTLERTFYVGEDVKQEDIKAKFDNGVLEINIPKVQAKPEVDTAQNIAIE